MKKTIMFITLFLSILNAQVKKPVNSTYYDQKKSIFELLPDTENEIVFLGNSITDGCEWSELFQNARIKNRGISGDQTAGVYARLDEVIASHPSKIFIMIGVNDLAARVSVDSIMHNYNKIVHKIRSSSPGTRIFIQSILPVHSAYVRFKNHTSKTDQILFLNKRLQELCNNLNIVYIDLHSRFKTIENQIDEKFTNDGLHLTGEGYLLWKSIIEKHVCD